MVEARLRSSGRGSGLALIALLLAPACGTSSPPPRKSVEQAGRRLRVCAVNDQVWSVIIITGLDKIFDFTDDVSTSLASLQLGV